MYPLQVYLQLSNAAFLGEKEMQNKSAEVIILFYLN